MAEPDINFYNVKSSLDEAFEELQFIYNEWFKAYPEGVKDVDFGREDEAFIKIKERQSRLRELNEHIKMIRSINTMLYKISKIIDPINAQCKLSLLTIRQQMNTIREMEGDIRRAEQRIQESINESNKNKRLAQKKSNHPMRKF